MKAFWLEEEGSPVIGADELAEQGIPNQSIPTVETDYQGPLDTLREAQGYTTQDQVKLSPETPNLEAICAKFKDEHYHDEDEVRFVLSGGGIFDIRSTDDRWMRVEVEPGDLIIVPAKRHHRFFLTKVNAIHCVRLFQDPSGWVAHYRHAA
jgi:1,2-dihydroxy-3-keto-5-methylthiopentene dioxygenase